MTTNTYIISKTNQQPLITPICNNEPQIPVISQSLYNCYLISHNQISIVSLYDSEMSYDSILKYIIPNYILISGIPGKNTFINKLIFKSIVYFDLVEIYNTHHIIDNKHTMNSLHVGPSADESKEGLFSKRTIKYEDDNHICLVEMNNVTYKQIQGLKYNNIFYELDDVSNLNTYVTQLMRVLMLLINNQSENGNCVIKINYTFHKPVIDVLFILSSMYNKVYITKPTSSNIVTYEKYIVCCDFDESTREQNKINYTTLFHFNKKYSGENNISRLLDYDLPCNFMNKIDDINLIYGQQQLEFMNTIISILKHKNKFERLDQTLKLNIQKTLQWCVRNNVPYNREYSEKINLFL
jgi:hypothetical protein